MRTKQFAAVAIIVLSSVATADAIEVIRQVMPDVNVEQQHKVLMAARIDSVVPALPYLALVLVPGIAFIISAWWAIRNWKTQSWPTSIGEIAYIEKVACSGRRGGQDGNAYSYIYYVAIMRYTYHVSGRLYNGEVAMRVGEEEVTRIEFGQGIKEEFLSPEGLLHVYSNPSNHSESILTKGLSAALTVPVCLVYLSLFILGLWIMPWRAGPAVTKLLLW